MEPSYRYVRGTGWVPVIALGVFTDADGVHWRIFRRKPVFGECYAYTYDLTGKDDARILKYFSEWGTGELDCSYSKFHERYFFSDNPQPDREFFVLERVS